MRKSSYDSIILENSEIYDDILDHLISLIQQEANTHLNFNPYYIIEEMDRRFEGCIEYRQNARPMLDSIILMINRFDSGLFRISAPKKKWYQKLCCCF